MIISASRRTDIPAFYARWFLNRLRAGWLLVPNPFQDIAYRVNLSPEHVTCIVFWTKNPEPIIPLLPEIDSLGHTYYFHFTVTPYGKDVEPFQKKHILDTFEKLARQIGSSKVIWRYDPIFLTPRYTVDFHIEKFSFLAQRFSGLTRKCVISFLDLYKSTKRKMRALNFTLPNEEQKRTMVEAFLEIAEKYGIVVTSCAEDLQALGVKPNKCIDDELISEITGRKLSFPKDRNQRTLCGCVSSIDVGIYDTCLHGCKYCYANYRNPKNVLARRVHDPRAPSLIPLSSTIRVIDRG